MSLKVQVASYLASTCVLGFILCLLDCLAMAFRQQCFLLMVQVASYLASTCLFSDSLANCDCELVLCSLGVVLCSLGVGFYSNRFGIWSTIRFGSADIYYPARRTMFWRHSLRYADFAVWAPK